METFFEKISNVSEAFEIREDQVLMGKKIKDCFDNNKSIIIEGPCGIGKGIGYLIPSLLLKEKVIISTGTITLQEQLLNKDIPELMNLLKISKTTAVAKGKGNYLCLNSFNKIKDKLPSYVTKEIQSKINSYWDGDKSKLETNIKYKDWDQIKCGELCSNKCDYKRECFNELQKKRIKKADIIVTNHSLYLTDLLNGTIFPTHRFVIFDEAHHLRTKTIDILTQEINNNNIQSLLDRIEYIFGMEIPKKIVKNIKHTSKGIYDHINDIVGQSEHETIKIKYISTDEFKKVIKLHIESINSLKMWFYNTKNKQLMLKLTNFFIAKNIKFKIIDQIEELVDQWRLFLKENENDLKNMKVKFVEIDRRNTQYKFSLVPVDVSEFLKTNLWLFKSCVLTSATLSVNNTCDFIKKDIGLDCEELILNSPFDFEKQAMLYVPSNLPDPNHVRYRSEIIKQIEQLINKTKGKTLVLFTSRTNMNLVYNKIKTKYPTKKQGQDSRYKLLKWFKEEENPVLLATATFWEGIDIPGKNLSSLIIDRIPFDVPTDPITEAKMKYYKSLGRNTFSDYMLPEAILKLKQGFGRLIRSKDDIGMVTILDNRLLLKSYGKTILNSLPKTKIYKNINQVNEFITENII